MMIEHRLHHAARELRGVPVDVPDVLGVGPTPRRIHRMPALAGPVLFVVGGIVAISGIGAGGQRFGDDFMDRDFVERVEEPSVATDRTPDVADTGTPEVPVVATPFAGQTFVPANGSQASAGEQDVSVEQELEMILGTRRSTGTRLDSPAARHEPPSGPI